LRAARVEALDQAANIVVAAEVNRGVGFVEREQAGIRRAGVIPLKSAARVQNNFGEAGGESSEAAFAIFQKIEMLNVGRDEHFAGGSFDEGEDGFAESAGLREFGEAPFAVNPIFREDDDDGVGAGDFAVERALPIRAGSKAGVLIEVSVKPFACSQVSRRAACSGSRLEWLMKICDMVVCRYVTRENTCARRGWQIIAAESGARARGGGTMRGRAEWCRLAAFWSAGEME
jgi:hypothetical protein